MKLTKLLGGMILGLPAALFLSYHPVISLGNGDSMNFELSVAVIYLVLFDIAAFFLLVQEKRFARLFDRWQFLILPIFMTASVFWSGNFVRGALTAGMIWAVYFAIMAMVVLRDKIFVGDFSRRFLKWFFGASLVVCAWCVSQCVMDMLGVSRECTLLCKGCVSQTFGFPHPNGFAIEPQFMGNLLLAPALVSGALLIKKKKPYLFLLFFVFSSTLFLTFSRGAIYAFALALIFMTIYYIVKKKGMWAWVLWPMALVAFLVTLNAQGLMSEFGPTSETYMGGISKVINHLSLGVIDLKVEKPVVLDDKNEAVFDGYVEESTNVRVGLTNSALKVWRKDFSTAMFGVGLGGAGEAMYAAGEIDSPKEIVQNEYASLLLEIGLVGVAIVVLMVVMVLKIVLKLENSGMILTLILAYAVTLLFFSGLPNALHVYLLPAIFGTIKK